MYVCICNADIWYEGSARIRRPKAAQRLVFQKVIIHAWWKSLGYTRYGIPIPNGLIRTRITQLLANQNMNFKNFLKV